jgi:predicted ATPase/class 3 adenylate cyclase
MRVLGLIGRLPMIESDRAAFVLPTGTVTFLFSDIQGSTRLLHEMGDGYADVLAQHRRVLRAAFAANNGVEIGTEGDSFFVAFGRASDAVAAAAEGQRGLEGGPVRVRMGLHTGEPMLTTEGYVGMVVHRAARIAAVGHGGQVLISEAVASLVADRLPTEVGLRDLGSVRLKDLAKPERVYQVLHPILQEVFPALRSLEATPNNLPQQVTSFIGREKAMAELEALLAKTRLLTLTGAGGAGKTRLSLQVAATALDDFPDGAWLIELAPLADPALVPQTVASVLGLREEPGKAITQTLTEHLKTRQLLLLLDNCEHLLAAGATLADTLVRQCAGVKILATSREALGIQGEQTYRVPSLSLPDRKDLATPATLSTYESVRLFIDRGLAVRPDFQVTNQNAPALASVCCRLDGIPLAIELAAARVRTLAVEEIDRKLGERFRLLTGGSKTALPRQQTLRALIDWSYELLHEPEQRLLQRLSVFAGGWTLEAAEAVCACEGVDKGDVFDLLSSLSDKSLVTGEQTEGHTRYGLLETVLEYAREKLTESGGEQAIRQRHRDYFLSLAQEARPKLLGPETAEWLQRLEDEHENLRAGFEWSLQETASGADLRFCGLLQRFWTIRGPYSEGRDWCTRALGKTGGEEPTAQRAGALHVAGELAYFQGDYLCARTQYEASLAILRQLGDRRGIAVSLLSSGTVAFEQGDYAAARSFYEQSLVIARELGDRSVIASILGNLGDLDLGEGRIASARTLLEESLAIRRSLGDLGGIAASLGMLGNVSFADGDLVSARKLHEESLALGRKLGDRIGTGTSLGNLGNVAIERHDYPVARALHEESLAIRRQLGDWQGIADSLEGLAAVASAPVGSLRAARVWGAAARLREEVGAPLPRIELPVYERRVAAARVALGDDAAFDRAWQEGRALTLEQAIELALNQTVEQP